VPEKRERTAGPEILAHYRQFSPFTYPGLYQEELMGLPSDVKEVGKLVRGQLIPVAVLGMGNALSNEDLRYGDMTKVPLYRQREDDNLPTTAAMLAELFRRDERGLVFDRKEEDRLVVTCRNTSLLMASILKSKGIPSRVRSGFAPYFEIYGDDKSVDHWINQYWDEEEGRWITIDVDGSIEPYLKFNPYDMPENAFDFPANVWPAVRQGEADEKRFYNQAGWEGLAAISEALFYDFHSLMGNEIVYVHYPQYAYGRFDQLTDGQLGELDDLAGLMQEPDQNFSRLKTLWETQKEFRILKGGTIR
jgi:hypothetical protein